MAFIQTLKDFKHFLEKEVVKFKMRLYAEKAIGILQQVATERNAPFWLMFGTLLGAYREHGLIKHDDDVDVGMMGADINLGLIDRLIKEGFVFKGLKISSDGKYRLAKLFYHGFRVDIYGFVYDDETKKKITGLSTQALVGHDKMYSIKNKKWRVRLIHVDYQGLELCKFGKSEFYIFKNAKDILADWYGENFMTPVKGFHQCVTHTIEVLPEEKMTATILNYDQLKKLEGK